MKMQSSSSDDDLMEAETGSGLNFGCWWDRTYGSTSIVVVVADVFMGDVTSVPHDHHDWLMQKFGKINLTKVVAFPRWDVCVVRKHLCSVGSLIFMVVFCANYSEENLRVKAFRLEVLQRLSFSRLISWRPSVWPPPPPAATALPAPVCLPLDSSRGYIILHVCLCVFLWRCHSVHSRDIKATSPQPLIQSWLGHRRKPPSWFAPEESDSTAGVTAAPPCLTWKWM